MKAEDTRDISGHRALCSEAGTVCLDAGKVFDGKKQFKEISLKSSICHVHYLYIEQVNLEIQTNNKLKANSHL